MLLSSALAAQGVSVDGNGVVRLSGFGQVDIEKTVQHWVEQHEPRMSSEFELRVDRIAEVCQLEESETKKLRLAAKGVVSKRINAARLQIRKFAFKSGLVEEDPGIDQEFEGRDELKLYSAQKHGEGTVEFASRFAVPMIDHPLWQATLKRALTDEKLKLYSDYRITTNTRVLRHGIDYWLSELDAKVILTDQQRTALTSRLLTRLSSEVTPFFPRMVRQARNLAKSSYRNDDSLGGLLNKKQIGLRTDIFVRSGVSW
jgi:predicted component of type VI protein secretion system